MHFLNVLIEPVNRAYHNLLGLFFTFSVFRHAVNALKCNCIVLDVDKLKLQSLPAIPLPHSNLNLQMQLRLLSILEGKGWNLELCKRSLLIQLGLPSLLCPSWGGCFGEKQEGRGREWIFTFRPTQLVELSRSQFDPEIFFHKAYVKFLWHLRQKRRIGHFATKYDNFSL